MKRTSILMFLVWSNTIFAHHYYIDGDLILGGLFPIHQSDVNEAGQSICNRKIRYEYGIQPLEAMIFTVNQINKGNILNNVKLGMWIFDYCDSPHIARQRSLNYFRVFAAEKYPDFNCSYQESKIKKTMAVIGAHSTAVTKQIAGMMSALSIPLVSHMATSPVLSDKLLYPLFSRTIPNDKHMGKAILRILDQLKWNYVSVVHSGTDYGIDGFQSMIDAKVNFANICFGPSYMITTTFENKDFDRMVDEFYGDNRPRVVVVFAERTTLTKLIFAVRRKHVPLPFTWIFADSALQMKPSKILMREIIDVLDGGLLVQPESVPLPGFDEYFKKLLIDNTNDTTYRWFREFLDQNSKCNEQIRDSCASHGIKVTKETFSQHRYLNYVRDAVYSVTYAIRKTMESNCDGVIDKLCVKNNIIASDVFEHMKNITFNDTAGRDFKFNDDMDGPVRYSISIIRKVPKISDGSYDCSNIGYYHGSDSEEFHLNESQMKYRQMGNDSWKDFPKSFCSCEPNDCARNQISIPVEKGASCAKCINCDDFAEIVDGACKSCPDGHKPFQNRSGCEAIPERSLDYSEPWAITAMAISVSGLAATLFVCCVYGLYWDTPLVSVCGRELSLVSLSGIMISCLMTSIIILEPSIRFCACIRFGVGISYTLCYAALLTNTIRIHSTFNCNVNMPNAFRYTSLRAQLTITGILTLIEILIIVIWLIAIPPEVTHLYPSRDINLKICSCLNDPSHLIGLAYPAILIVSSTIYAFKIRKCWDGFNQISYIGITNYTTIILWLSYVPLYLFWNNYSNRVSTLAISLSLNGWVELVCSFGPKIYIILFRPQKNTEAFASATISTNLLHRTITNIIGSTRK